MKISDYQIFELLYKEPMTVMELAKALNVLWESTLARRLRRFTELGIVSRKKVGNTFVYWISDLHSTKIKAYLGEVSLPK